ncbi:uncharacterized protein LOC131670236 isoform X2 [Phymastichus coffea]|uniref:uncharacterized protein LOC131670236 isoform X2 n=1 Tax=Phymastichus coffea TaxID=108790 RepID=UPI00273AF990|nr:uncharacterized protein LOC131670236 isoform X2 [Phymastichus coffea]
MFSVQIVYYQFNVEYVDQLADRDSNGSQDRRKLLKRTRSLAVISEDDCRTANGSRGSSCEALRLGSSCGSSNLPFDSSSLQHRRHQLIPRAKLIDRNSLKDRLSKSQQHLYDCYERLNDTTSAPAPPPSRSRQSRSVCGLYNSLPPPHTNLAESHLPYTRVAATYRPSTAAEPPDRLNILKWPESPRRYRSVQDLNSVSGLVDIVEDHYWPIEENRSVDCIYTQVKRKRKEHRSLDSILFEDDSDELEYFDILNLLPLSNVRLEINESDATNSHSILERNCKQQPLPNRPPSAKLNPAVVSVSTKKNFLESEICPKHYPTARITEIVEENKEPGITSFPEIAREKSRLENTFYAYDGISDSSKITTKAVVESCHSEIKDLEKYCELNQDKKEPCSVEYLNKPKVEETEDTKSLWISDNEEVEEMSRRPQILKVIDNDITKSKKKSISKEVKSADDEITQAENMSENTTNFRTLNKPDIINDHIHESPSNFEPEKEKDRISVENARSFFEKKNADTETNRGEGRLERIVKETSNILGKACHAVKGSLGFEARSDSSDLGLGSEIGSDVRRLSVDENINTNEERNKEQKHNKQDKIHQNFDEIDDNNQKNSTNLIRSRSCIDSMECQNSDEPEFDHVRYKIVKSNMFGKSMYNTAKKDVPYDGLMQYLREYSFQDLLNDNNVVIIEPVRAEIERKPSFNNSTLKTAPSFNVEKIKISDLKNSEEAGDSKIKNHFSKAPRQSSLRKHFFYQPIQVNRELNDEELPDPDTVRNVRRMFEETSNGKLNRDNGTRKCVSMKDLRTIEGQSEAPRSRCSSRAKDLKIMFENLEKSSNPSLTKDGTNSSKHESKTKLIAQSFEARSGFTSPSNSNSSKTRVNRYYQRQLPNWDAGSVSSGVSSDYPDTDAGSAPHCTSSEDEDLYYNDDDGVDERYEGHYVSQDVLKKIREYGTSVTYYGGKVVNTSNGPLICPMVCKNSKKKTLDYIKFRLVKSNSCDSRLELTGRVIEHRNKFENAGQRGKLFDLRQFTIDETPSIEITSIETINNTEKDEDKVEVKDEKREPPVVIGLEPKKDENKSFKVEFKLGKLEDGTSINRFTPSALTRWQINENTWKRTSDFGKMEFEEFEVLEDSLNGVDN